MTMAAERQWCAAQASPADAWAQAYCVVRGLEIEAAGYPEPQRQMAHPARPAKHQR
jgi:hypothetical protein